MGIGGVNNTGGIAKPTTAALIKRLSAEPSAQNTPAPAKN
jgi:hypothetical protein